MATVDRWYSYFSKYCRAHDFRWHAEELAFLCILGTRFIQRTLWKSEEITRRQEMNIRKLLKCSSIALRWMARILGSLLVILVLTIVIGEGFFYSGDGLPNPFAQPLPVAIELFGMATMWVGCIIGWKWQGVGAILTIVGIMTFHVIEKRLLLMGAFPLFDLAAILFLFSWLLNKQQKKMDLALDKMLCGEC